MAGGLAYLGFREQLVTARDVPTAQMGNGLRRVASASLSPPSAPSSTFLMPETFIWSSPAGFQLVRRIIKSTAIPYEPHDYQLEGVCKSLDGIDLFAITPTGSGKTGYYILYILVVLAVIKDPTLCPSAKFPENPCLLIICPTIPLQMEMVRDLRSCRAPSRTFG